MKCLLLTLDYPPNRPGGMANYFAGIARHFPGGNMVVLTGSAHGASSTDEPCTVYRAPVHSGASVFVPLWIWLCLRIMRREGITLIVCGNASPFKYVAMACRRLTGVPFVVHFFGNDLLRLRRRMRRSERAGIAARRMASRASALVACSAFTADRAAETLACPRGRVVVTYPGIDDAFLNRETAPPRLSSDEPLRIVSVGRLVARKGFDRVIESLAVLRDRSLHATYTLIGKGDQEPLRRLAERCGVADRVTFAGFLPDTRVLIDTLCGAHVFAMVSRVEGQGTDVEGFGTVFLEAGALKRPSVAGRTGGIPEAVLHMETGILVDNPDSPDEIAEAFGTFIERPALLRRMGEAACRRAHESFRQPVLYAQLHDQLQRLVSGAGGRS